MNEYRCRCGALLPVGGEPQVLPRCPSCREAYGFPQFGTDSPTPPSRTSIWLGAAMGGGALVLAGFLFAAVWTLTRPKNGLAAARTSALDPRPVARSGRSPQPVAEPPPAPGTSQPAKAAPLVSPEETLATVVRINRIIARKNMSGIVAAVLLNTGRRPEAEEVEVVLWKGDLELRQEMEKLPANFDLRRIAAHHEYGDRLLTFGSSSLDPARPRLFAEALQAWLRNFQVGTTNLASLRRGQETILVEMYFAEAGPELADLASRASVLLGGRAWK